MTFEARKTPTAKRHFNAKEYEHRSCEYTCTGAGLPSSNRSPPPPSARNGIITFGGAPAHWKSTLIRRTTNEACQAHTADEHQKLSNDSNEWPPGSPAWNYDFEAYDIRTATDFALTNTASSSDIGITSSWDLTSFESAESHIIDTTGFIENDYNVDEFNRASNATSIALSEVSSEPGSACPGRNYELQESQP